MHYGHALLVKHTETGEFYRVSNQVCWKDGEDYKCGKDGEDHKYSEEEFLRDLMAEEELEAPDLLELKYQYLILTYPLWIHFKGGHYIVINMVRDSDHNAFVHYKSLDNIEYLRPLRSWSSEVEDNPR